MKDRIIAVTVLLLAISLRMLAIPAERGLHTYVQPDGTSVSFIITGDEFSKTTTSIDGHVITLDDRGYFRNAAFDPMASLRIANASRMRAYAMRRRAEAARRTAESLSIHTRSGKPKVKALIIPAQFQDLKFRFKRSDFEAMLNEEGYSYNGATGSARDYFLDQFEGKCDIEFVVSPIVTVSKGYAYYGRNGGSDDFDEHPAEIVAEACRQLDSQTDFSEFDSDNDGMVDHIFVFVAGGDEARGAGEDHIWSHQWNLEDSGIYLKLDGKQISTYAMSTELNSTGTDIEFATIGTFCHEFSHCLGLSDLYDTEHDYEDTERSDGVWAYTSLMDYGNYNNDGKTPPNYNAVEMELLGIGSMRPLEEGTHTLAPLSQEKTYFKAETDTKGEYYLFECRAAEGWDKHIGGSGMLIYHVDSRTSHNDAGYSEKFGIEMTAAERWENNCINGNRLHQCVDIAESNPNASDVFQVFWPNGNFNTFSPDGSPAYRYWNGNGPKDFISGIRKNGTSVTFSVTGPLSIESVEAFQDAAIILWTMQGTGKGRISLTGPDGRTQTKDVDPFGTNRYSYVFEGLAPKTTYKVTVTETGSGAHKLSEEFTTKAYYSDGYPFIYLNSADRNSDGSFKKGSRLPLRVFNAENAREVMWYFDSNVLSSDGSGYFFVENSGTIKAVITYGDGTRDIISKTITLR